MAQTQPELVSWRCPIERGGVASAGCDHWKYFLQVITVKLRCEHLLARVHPVHVAAHGVDLAVVTEIAIWMSELPGRKSVGGKPLVDQTERAHRVRIGQFVIELGDLRSEQQSFVDDGARRKRRNVEEAFVRQIRGCDFRFSALAYDVQLAFELVFGHTRCAGNKYLFDIRLRCTCHASDGIRIHRRVAPA